VYRVISNFAPQHKSKIMAAFDLITKDDLEKFKVELFAELKRPTYLCI